LLLPFGQVLGDLGETAAKCRAALKRASRAEFAGRRKRITGSDQRFTFVELVELRSRERDDLVFMAAARMWSRVLALCWRR
jgi:hypothetical protein